MATTLNQAETLKGSKLNTVEKKIVELFGDNPKYVIQLDSRGKIMAHKVDSSPKEGER